MVFCAQYNLEECAKYDINKQLPAKGLISIFVDRDLQSFEFNYFSNNDLLRSVYPEQLSREFQLDTHKMAFFDLPTVPVLEIEHLLEKYDELNELVMEYCGEFIREINNDIYNNHQILGHELPIQNPPRLVFAWNELGLNPTDYDNFISHEAEISSLAKEYEILLQIDFDTFDSGLNFHNVLGDGTLYFGIKTEDLKQSNFENVVMEYQLT